MSTRSRNKVSYNVDEALDYLLESDGEDLRQLEDDNGGDSSTNFEYNDDDNIVLTATNVSIPGVDQDVERVEFVVQEERPKRKRNIGPIMSLDTSLDETNYDAFDPPIPEECLESNIDKTPYKWTASTVSSGRCNAANIMPLRPRPQKRVLNKKEPIDISTNIFTDDMITTVLNNTNKKIMALIEQLPEEVRSNDKYKSLREVTKEELLAFFGISYARGLLGQNFLKLRRLFSVDVGHPIFSASMSFNRLVFIKAMISFDDANTRQETWQTDRFAAFREIFEEFNKCCTKNMSPDDYIAIDETLYPTRGGISFKTYNKDKPDKYGPNFRTLGSSRRPYLLCYIPERQYK